MPHGPQSPLQVYLRLLNLQRGASRALPRNDIQSPVGYLPITDTLTLPDTRIMRVRMDGQDASGNVRPVYNWSFVSSDTSVFTVQDTDDERIKLIVPGPDLFLSGLARTATLTVTGTPDANIGAPVLTRVFTVNVIPVDAFEISLYLSINGGRERFIASGLFPDIPVNLTAVVRMALVDRKGRNVVPTNVVWSGGAPQFHLVATTNPQIVTLVPDTLGFNGFDVSCDIIVASETVHLSQGYNPNIIASAATVLAGQYDIELP